MEDKLILRYFKYVDVAGRVLIPKEMQKKFGKYCYLEIYEKDGKITYIKLIPTEKEK